MFVVMRYEHFEQVQRYWKLFKQHLTTSISANKRVKKR